MAREPLWKREILHMYCIVIKAYIAKKAWQGYPRSGHKTTSKRRFRLVISSVFFILVHHSVLAFPHLCSGKKSGSGSSQPLPFLSLPWRDKQTQTAKDNEHEYCVQVGAWTTWIQLRTSEIMKWLSRNSTLPWPPHQSKCGLHHLTSAAAATLRGTELKYVTCDCTNH